MIRAALYRLLAWIAGPPSATVTHHEEAALVVVRCTRCSACAVFSVTCGETSVKTDHVCPGQMVPVVTKNQEKEALWPSA